MNTPIGTLVEKKKEIESLLETKQTQLTLLEEQIGCIQQELIQYELAINLIAVGVEKTIASVFGKIDFLEE